RRDLQAARGARDLRRISVHTDGEDPAPRHHAAGARAPRPIAMTTIIDMHSHWGTRRGYPFQTLEELAQQERVFKSKPRSVSESEMAEHFRKTGARVIL